MRPTFPCDIATYEKQPVEKTFCGRAKTARPQNLENPAGFPLSHRLDDEGFKVKKGDYDVEMCKPCGRNDV